MAKPLSESLENLLQDSSTSTVAVRPESIWRWLVKQWISLVIIVLLLYNTIITTVGIFSEAVEPDLPYSRYRQGLKSSPAYATSAPANPAIKYERQRLWDGESTIYWNSPSEEVDAAWHDLLAGKIFMIHSLWVIWTHESSHRRKHSSIQRGNGSRKRGPQ